jgi:hypothetical protein
MSMNELADRSSTGNRRHGIAEGKVSSFIAQLAIATLGAHLLAILISFFIATLTALIGKNESGGNFADHLLDQRVFMLSSHPYFVLPIIVSLCLGMLCHRFFPSRSGAWIWLLPTIVLIGGVLSWKPGNLPYWGTVWNNYFGSHCGGSECLYELFITSPFYTSIAYSVGWSIQRLKQQEKIAQI